MDDFENEYFSKITLIASDFKERRRELAKSRIKMFTAAICRQLIDFKEEYDLVVGAGNSGLFMAKITAMVFEHLNIKAPLVLNLPINRFKEDGSTLHDNSFLITQVKEKLRDMRVSNILFVDDEIMRGLTAKECFQLILEANSSIDHLDATIIAENHFFEWHHKMSKVSISFFAYSPLIQGLNGNIGYFVPKDFYKEISAMYAGKLSRNHVASILIGGGLKRKANSGNSYFDFAIESELKNKVSDYDKKKSSLVGELKELVKEGIKKYKVGEIKFRF